MLQRHGDLIDRFHAGFIPEPNSGCWLWLGTGDAQSYPTIRRGKGVAREKVHRFSYRLHRGPIPEGLQVLHTCDMFCCVNPDHLFLGTQADNIADKMRKDRHPKGMEWEHAKLTDADIVWIRSHASKRHRLFSHRAIAKRFGVSSPTIDRIVSRKVWKHIA